MEKKLRIIGSEQRERFKIYRVVKDTNEMLSVDATPSGSVEVKEYQIRCHNPQIKLLRGWGIPVKVKPKKVVRKKPLLKLSKIDKEMVKLWRYMWSERNSIPHVSYRTWEEFCRTEFNVNIDT